MRACPTEWQSVTLMLPAKTVMATINGRWRRTPGGLQATYTRDELSVCLFLTEVWAKHERGQEVRLPVDGNHWRR